MKREDTPLEELWNNSVTAVLDLIIKKLSNFQIPIWSSVWR